MTANRTPRSPLRLRLFLAGILALLPLCESLADDWFMKIDGIPGELTEGKLAGWTRLTSVGAVVRRPDPTNPSAGQATFSCVIRKAADRTSPALLQRCGTGEHLRRVTLAYVLTNPAAAQYRITLDDVVVSSINQEGSQNPPGSGFGEIVAIAFQKIEWACFTLDASGGTAGGLTALFDSTTGEGSTKPRRPFRATIERRSGQAGVLVTCPVESGHRYRILATPALDKPWSTLLEFTASEDGDSSQFVAMSSPALFMRVEEID